MLAGVAVTDQVGGDGCYTDQNADANVLVPSTIGRADGNTSSSVRSRQVGRC